ncbi:NAD(P)/FAD-dependent oxidoreductase [Uliginosibacterium sp. H3]|uniref:NAD(P)/FAD-dependent oxidoreductase n=1 Tax=Uliginosibacterium silvisoli TaxID=3114758 RepID=A0ABU6K3F5_9RHOO|nr:NAD(P)/FAD-dependent oxidoreductase [Uliginosibacterium sp. H3]
MSNTAEALEQLEKEVARSLRYLGDAPENWVPSREGVDHDVLIVGGGQSGVTTAFGLRRNGIHNVSVIDSADENTVGAWQTKARMRVLRTAKKNTGPDLGIPALSFRAWYETQHGEAAYEAITRVATSDWIDYLAWVRKTLRVPVRFGTRLLRVEAVRASSEGVDFFRLHLEAEGKAFVETARKIVLATGAVGGGLPFIPQLIEQLPANLRAHTDDAIDFAALAGKRVAVIGAASSAFDAAGVALEAGAARVHLFARSADVVRASPGKQVTYPGAANHFFDLPDTERWRLAQHLRGRSPGPMLETVQRATRFDNFHLHFNASVRGATLIEGGVELDVDGELFEFDYVIAGTGYRIDAALRPELAAFAEDIAVWADKPVVDAERDAQSSALRFPYLGAGYEFTEKVPGRAPLLRNIHCFNYSAITSYGRHVGDVSSLTTGVPRLVSAISRDFFLEDYDLHLQRITGSGAFELTGAEYAHSIWQKEAEKQADGLTV